MWHLLRTHPAVCVAPEGARTGPKPVAVLPGSFNPLHHGHTSLARVAAARLGVDVHYELSVANADKPDLPRREVFRRVSQFAGVGPVWITRAATFEQKADLFPHGVAFVLGWDTAVRVIDPKYYGGEAGRDAALRKLAARGCRLVVGGRLDATGAFRVWDGGLADEFAGLFVALTEADFRADVSSTELRTKTPVG